MVTKFIHRRHDLLGGFRQLRSALPETMTGFAKLHRAAMADGELSSADKELIAIGISVATHCEGCIALHVHDALSKGASSAQIREAVGVAIMMGGGAAATSGSEALEALEQFNSERVREAQSSGV